MKIILAAAAFLAVSFFMGVVIGMVAYDEDPEAWEREDLEQELYIKLIEKIDRLIYQEGPGFWEFIVEYMTKL